MFILTCEILNSGSRIEYKNMIHLVLYSLMYQQPNSSIVSELSCAVNIWPYYYSMNIEILFEFIHVNQLFVHI